MKIATMLGDVWQSIWQRPITQKYPFERLEAPVRLRGKLHWNPEKCTGCALCNKDCPANAIEIITVDKKEKRFVMKYHMDRCTYCAQCVESCRFSCIEMSDEEWELAATDKTPFTVTYGTENDLREFMAKFADANITTPAS
ncbi:MAG: 4Fe-4S binding protein [Chloroflexi bacterium]|nr:4Fe-4S binding protein [Chloroflexota bacterium]MBK6712932.1 4Fe-4S binding protein [Chloroflexota bacterium]MBK7177460.1 4Fe-4S binding protein [Chloroflexota bacterium]MBK7918848.1 4Fe-4S binding protein [Chloroflexota bacterium]